MGRTKQRPKSRDKAKPVVKHKSWFNTIRDNWFALFFGLGGFLIFQFWVVSLFAPKQPMFSRCLNVYQQQSEIEFLEGLAMACFRAAPVLNKSDSVQKMESIYAKKNDFWTAFVFTRENFNSELSDFRVTFLDFKEEATKKTISEFCQSVLTLYKVKPFIPLELFVVQNFQQTLKISMNNVDRKCVTKIFKRGEYREKSQEFYTKIILQLNAYDYSTREIFVKFLDDLLEDYHVSFKPRTSREDGIGRNKRTVITPARITLLSTDGLLDDPENTFWKNIVKLIAFINDTNEKFDIEFTSREMSYFANDLITEEQIPITFN